MEREGDGDVCEPGEMYGYARVSTTGQNLDRQLDALTEYGIASTNVFADKASGKDFNREAYLALKAVLRPGDVMVVLSLDRLGRDYDEILYEWRDITERIGADIVVLDMPLLDTRSPADNLTGKLIANLVLQVLSYVAQTERESTHARQAQGIASAKARGVQFGRPRAKVPEIWESVRDAFDEGLITRAEAAERLGVSTSTFDRWRRNGVDADRLSD